VLTVVKGLPLTFNKDFQEDKEGLFDAVDTTLAVLDVFPPMLRTATFNREKMAEAAIGDFSLATDAADLLARNGVPFREAHEVVGRLVADCVDRGKSFADLTDEEWAGVHPVFARQRPPLSAIESVTARDIEGGTAPGQIQKQLGSERAQMIRWREWLAQLDEAHAALFARPNSDEGQ
jgi:argininosuccinate lyase